MRLERDGRPQPGNAAADDEEVGSELVGHQRPWLHVFAPVVTHQLQ